MNATAIGEENPSSKIDILGAILKVLNHPTSAVIFCIACLIFDFAGTVQTGKAIDAWWGGLFALMVLVVTLLITLGVCFIVQMIYNPQDEWRKVQPFQKVFGDTTVGVWATFGPAFLTLAAFAFIVYPVKESALVVDGEKMTHWAWVNPWTQKIMYVDCKQPVSTGATAICKGGVRIRGNISAEFTLVENPGVYISNNEIQAKAEEELERCFEATVSKLSPHELEHTIVIEFDVGELANLAKLGIKWKNGSVIEVSNIHAAPPES